MSQTTKYAVSKYSAQICLRAFELNAKHGEGPSTIACYLGLSGSRAANAAINAGRELSGKGCK